MSAENGVEWRSYDGAGVEFAYTGGAWACPDGALRQSGAVLRGSSGSG